MRASCFIALVLAGMLAQQSSAQSISSSLATQDHATQRQATQHSAAAGVGGSELMLAQQHGISVTSAAGAALTLSSVARAASLESQQEKWQATIDDLIAQGGVYGSGLDEAYQGFGSMQLRAGNQQAAAILFRQAWQVSRINHGLYSEEQLPHLNQLIEALVALEQWEQVHELHQLSFLIASRVYPPDDLRYVIAAEFYTSWKWQAINRNITFAGYTSGFELAQELSAFYEEVIDRVEHSDTDHNDRLASLILGKARTDISLARALLRSQHRRNLASPDYITETECSDRIYGPAGTTRNCRRVKLANYNFGDSPTPTIHFALGRYLEQVERSIGRLERIRESAKGLNNAERNWIDSLIAMLERESEAVLQTAGFR